MTATTDNNGTTAPLPAIHPGTPGHARVSVVDVKFVRQTEKAVLFERPASGRTSWVPKSAVRFTEPRFPTKTLINIDVAVWFYGKLRTAL